MSRPYGAAIFAVALVTLASGAADAKSKDSSSKPIVVSSLARNVTSVEAARIAPLADANAFRIAPEIRAKLAAAEAASTMPTERADVAMWSGTTLADLPARKLHPRVRSAAGGDAIHRFASGIISRTSSIAMSLTRSAMRFIGTPYVFGGTSPTGFDCSGYTQHVFAMLGIPLPRTADAQYYAGRPTIGGMTTGDLVFFQTYEPGPSHVGIYVGGGKFIHSSSHGVMVSRLDNSYWRARYIGAKRIVAFR